MSKHAAISVHELWESQAAAIWQKRFRKEPHTEMMWNVDIEIIGRYWQIGGGIGIWIYGICLKTFGLWPCGFLLGKRGITALPGASRWWTPLSVQMRIPCNKPGWNVVNSTWMQCNAAQSWQYLLSVKSLGFVPRRSGEKLLKHTRNTRAQRELTASSTACQMYPHVASPSLKAKHFVSGIWNIQQLVLSTPGCKL